MEDGFIKLIETQLGVTINLGAFAVTWGILSFLGTRVKKLPNIENDYIPLVLALVGSVVYVGAAWLLDVPFQKGGFVIGFVNGFAAVGGHQCFTRTKAAVTQSTNQTP